MVHVDEKARPVGAEFLFCVLQEESRLSHASCALDADEPVSPVNLVHQAASHGGVGMLHQVAMCPKKSLHGPFFHAANIAILLQFANWS
jgi:hypothetical protein